MAHLGCGWMTTPYRSLVLVHATQQPVCLPEFLDLSAQREGLTALKIDLWRVPDHELGYVAEPRTALLAGTVIADVGLAVSYTKLLAGPMPTLPARSVTYSDTE